MTSKYCLFVLLLCFIIINVEAQIQSINNLSFHCNETNSGLRIVTKFERNDGAGKAIIIQRHRNDTATDKLVEKYIQNSKNSLKKLKISNVSGCSNLDLEEGDFTNWLGQTGVNNGYPAGSWVNGFDSLRHNIVSNGTDPYGGFPVLAPNGGNFSIKLGNDNINYEAEQLIYTFIVQPQDTNLIYKYAVVLEDPAHTSTEQPYFEFKVMDQNDSIIPCTQIRYVSSGSIPGFYNYGDIRYKPWTTTGINLASYIGQEVTIIATTADCAQGAHFGYAYLDFICSSTPAVYCLNDTLATLSLFDVDPGMIYNWSTGQTGPAITFNPQLYNGNSINCYIESPTSVGLCGYWYSFPIEVFNTSLTVTDSSITVNEPGLIYRWVNCSNGYEVLPNDTNQFFLTDMSGSYAVIVSNGICSDTSDCITLNTNHQVLSSSGKFKIFPNPISDKLIIEFSDYENEIYYEVISSVGSIVRKGKFLRSTMIKSTDFKSGVYLINCYLGNTLLSKTIIKL